MRNLTPWAYLASLVIAASCALAGAAEADKPATQPATPVLAFCIPYTPETASDADKAEADRMVDRLRTQGPASLPADRLRWYELGDAELGGRPVQKWQDRSWVLCHATADKSMVYGDPTAPWALDRVFREVNPQTGKLSIAFVFDARGAKLFGQLTEAHIRQPLAIIVDGKVLSAPTIQSRIERNGIITGKWTQQEVDRIIRVLRRAVE